MYKRILGLTTYALILAYGVGAAFAQNQMIPQPGQQQAQSPAGSQEGPGPMGHGSMMDGEMMKHMMGRSMMGGGVMGAPLMMRMMFALMDADGDGKISLQEFQTAHERIFKAMDSNKDGQLTPDEMEAFIHGNR
jgi:hypothetical protein